MSIQDQWLIFDEHHYIKFQSVCLEAKNTIILGMYLIGEEHCKIICIEIYLKNTWLYGIINYIEDRTSGYRLAMNQNIKINRARRSVARKWEQNEVQTSCSLGTSSLTQRSFFDTVLKITYFKFFIIIDV